MNDLNRQTQDAHRVPSFSGVETSSAVGMPPTNTSTPGPPPQAPAPQTSPVIPSYIPGREVIYEEIPQNLQKLPEESPKRRVTIGTEEIIFPDDPARVAKDFDHRTLTFNSRGKVRISVVGGNADGIFVHRIDPGSEAEQAGLMEGDQVLKINGQSIGGLTKEEVMLMLMSLSQQMELVVRYKRDRYDHIAANSGMGDSFFVKAHFNYEPQQSGEMRIHEGDVLSVRDTLPDGKMGSWRALKVNARPNEVQHGLVPNQGRAEQVALAQRKAPGTPRGRTLEKEPKQGFLRRSFRRSKSAERLTKETEAFSREPQPSVIKPAYERVEQRPPGFLRPVAIVGLFCDTVRDRLAQDAPGLFEMAPPEVEIPTSREEGDAGKAPVNLNIIRAITDRRKHCLMIISPRAIQYLLQTPFFPIVIYLSPGSKAIIKVLRQQFAPTFEKRSSFMYDEAHQFEKMYSQLFTATVTYTVDDQWYTLLKDTINRIQNQPLWQPAPKIRPANNDLSPDPVRRGNQNNNNNPNARGPPGGKTIPRGRSITRQIPNALQNVIQRHAGSSDTQDPNMSLASITSIESHDSSRPKQPMTLTYDGYFLSGDSMDELPSSESSVTGGGAPRQQPIHNGHPQPGIDITPVGTPKLTHPKSILKNRNMSYSMSAASDYESDMSFSGDPGPNLVNGYIPRGNNNVTVLSMEPKRVMPKQMKPSENGHHLQTFSSSPAMTRHPTTQNAMQIHLATNQQPGNKQLNPPSNQQGAMMHQATPPMHQATPPQPQQVCTLQCFRFRLQENWPLFMKTILSDLFSDQDIIDAIINNLKEEPPDVRENSIVSLLELWINFRWPSQANQQ